MTQAVAARLCSIVDRGPGSSWILWGRETLECRATNQASESGGGEEGRKALSSRLRGKEYCGTMGKMETTLPSTCQLHFIDRTTMSLIRFPLRLPLPSFQFLFTALKASFSLLSCAWQAIQLLHLLCNGWLFLRATKCFQLKEYERINDELRCIHSLPMEDVDDESVTRLLWQMDTLDAMSTRQVEAERDQAIFFARLWDMFTPHVF